MSISIISKLSLFTEWLLVTAMVLVVTLVLLRVLAGYANLNFFGWTFVTLRRFADPLVGRVRRALIGFRVDGKYAPLATILIVLLLWWVLTVATTSTFDTIIKVILAVQAQAIARVVGHVLVGLLKLYTLLLFMRIVFSWVMVSYSNRLMRFLYMTTEPLLGPLRRMIPPVGVFDVSALFAFIILWLVQLVVEGTFLRG